MNCEYQPYKSPTWQKHRCLLLTIQARTTVKSTLLRQVVPAPWSSQKPQPFFQDESDQHASLHNVLHVSLPGKHMHDNIWKK